MIVFNTEIQIIYKIMMITSGLIAIYVKTQDYKRMSLNAHTSIYKVEQPLFNKTVLYDARTYESIIIFKRIYLLTSHSHHFCQYCLFHFSQQTYGLEMNI